MPALRRAALDGQHAAARAVPLPDGPAGEAGVRGLRRGDDGAKPGAAPALELRRAPAEHGRHGVHVRLRDAHTEAVQVQPPDFCLREVVLVGAPGGAQGPVGGE